MKNQLLFFLIVINPVLGLTQYSQTDYSELCPFKFDSLTSMKVYVYAQKEPEFIEVGGVDLHNFILENIVYPEMSKESKDSNEFAIIWVELIVVVDGNIFGVRIKNKIPELYTPMEKRIIGVVESMADWTPGECDGVRIPVKVDLPIYINVN